MEVVLYKGLTCPQCVVAKKKLEKKGIVFTEVTDVDVMTELGITSIPSLGVDGTIISGLMNVKNWIDAQEDKVNG